MRITRGIETTPLYLRNLLPLKFDVFFALRQVVSQSKYNHQEYSPDQDIMYYS